MRAAPLVLLLVACGTSSSPSSPIDAAAQDGSSADASLARSCDSECRNTALVATFGAVTAPFDRAQLGIDPNDGGAPSLRVEVYAGGDPACPTETSPTPDRTLVVSGLHVPTSSAPLTEKDGIVVSLLDFKGDLATAPVVKATAVTLVPAAAATEPAASAFVAIDLTATFAGGTVKGHLYATHCDSLDGP